MEEERVWMDRLEEWWSSPVRNVLYALGVAALLVYGAYGEAHPTGSGRRRQGMRLRGRNVRGF